MRGVRDFRHEKLSTPNCQSSSAIRSVGLVRSSRSTLAAILLILFVFTAPFSLFSVSDFTQIDDNHKQQRWRDDDTPTYRRTTMAASAMSTHSHYTRFHHRHNRYYYKPRYYRVTLSIRNHNVTEASFFRLVGVDNTVDFHVAPGNIFTNTYEVNRKGYWTLFVEFPGDRYAKSPRKIISRDSHSHWIMEVYYYPESVGFSEWHKMHRPLDRNS